MKKFMKNTLAVVFCIGFSLMANAQKAIKEGAAIYSVQYDLPPDQQSMAAMLPKEFVVTFKGDFTKFKMDMGMFATTIVSNSATKESLSLTEVPMQNKKIATKMNAEQTEKMHEMQSGDQDFTVTATTESKKIAGYNCIKYILIDKESKTETEVWATNDIQIPSNNFTSALKGIKGVPIEFSTNARGVKTKMTLKSISENPVADIDFQIPNGYELMDFNDLLRQMGG